MMYGGVEDHLPLFSLMSCARCNELLWMHIHILYMAMWGFVRTLSYISRNKLTYNYLQYTTKFMNFDVKVLFLSF